MSYPVGRRLEGWRELERGGRVVGGRGGRNCEKAKQGRGMVQHGARQLQGHQASHRRKFGGGDSLKWHEELVELGIFICLNHEELGMGHLALDRRDKLDAHFRGPDGPISDRRAATGGLGSSPAHVSALHGTS